MENKTMWIVGGAALVLVLVMSRGGGGVRSLGPLPVDPSVAERERSRWTFAREGFSALASSWANVQRAGYDAESRATLAAAQRDASLAQSDAYRYASRQAARGKSGFKIGVPGVGEIGFNW